MTYKFKRVLIIYLTLILLLNTTFLFFNSVKVRTGIFDLNPKIPAFQLCNAALPLQGKIIGWVETHGEDPYNNPPFNIYITTLNDAIVMGAILNNITSEINSTLLNSYDIIVLEEGGSNWTASELIDLDNWVKNGGSLYILGDNCDDAQVNVSAKFNVFYNDTDPEDGDLILNKKYPILEGVNSINAFFPSASTEIQTSRNDLMIIAWTEDDGPIIVALQEEQGRILWNIDADGIIDNSRIINADNHLLANNSWLWLTGILGNEYKSTPFSSLELLILLLIYENSIIIPIDMFILIISGSLATVISTIVIIYYRKKRNHAR